MNRLPAIAPNVAAPGDLTRGLLLTATSLLMCLPIVVIVKSRPQGSATAGAPREILPAALTLGVVLALVTIALFAAIMLLGKGTLAPRNPVTLQCLPYLITTFTISTGIIV